MTGGAEPFHPLLSLILHPYGTLLLNGVLFGLGAAVPIGPVNVEIARRSLRGGFWAGFALGCGAVSVDVTYAVLSSLSVRELAHHSKLMWPLTVAGAAFLLWLSFLSLRAAFRDARSDP